MASSTIPTKAEALLFGSRRTKSITSQGILGGFRIFGGRASGAPSRGRPRSSSGFNVVMGERTACASSVPSSRDPLSPEAPWPDKEEGRLWQQVRAEAARDAEQEPLLSSFLYASILAHGSFPQCLAFVLSTRLADVTLLPTELFEVFSATLAARPEVVSAALADLAAVRQRDPACCAASQALLYFKGYHALETHRIAHVLWGAGRRMMATALQARCNEVFAVDIHPAARIGRGVLLDHGTGVVVGATAVVGDNVSILQNVTLGGTGKESGDRHPKIGNYVLIGASATVLGNIPVGEGAQIAAGSLVLKPVAPHTMVAGSPAREVGRITGLPAICMEQWRECEGAADTQRQAVGSKEPRNEPSTADMAADTSSLEYVI